MSNYISTGITVTFGALTAEIVDVDYSGETADVEDVTHQLSTSAHKEKKAGLIDAGQVTLLLHYGGTVPAAGTTDTLLVAFPDGKTLSCTAVLQKCRGAGATLGKKITSPATFELSGVPTWS